MIEKIDTRKAVMDALESAGRGMSNICFNLSQESYIAASLRMSMKKAQGEWDLALRALIDLERQETPAPSSHVAVAEAAKRYLAAIDSAPENDIWDTWDGKPAEGAPKTASDASWHEHGQKIEACLSELRAALATMEGK